MKKSKLSLGLVTGFVASLALAACGSVKAKDHSLLSYTGYDGTKYEIVTEKMYQEYRKDSKVISTFYDKVLEVLIRDLFASGYSNGAKSYATIEATAKADVKAAKDKASENAKSNSTSYEKEWDAILSSEGVEDEKELLQKYIYKQEKEVLEDDIYQSLNKADKLKMDWIEGALPYHIRHILAKVDGGASDYTRGTITAEQAKKISDAGLELGRGINTFGGVAALTSEDGSKDSYGDVGLVTNKATSSGTFTMVTEFQLAIYIYDCIYKGRADSKGLVTDQAAATFDNITRVPFEVFKQLATKENGGLGDVVDFNGKQVGDGEASVYPRNILWNKYLNHHEPFLITNDTIADSVDITPTFEDWDQLEANSYGPADASIVAQTGNVTGFRKASTVGITLAGDPLILTDEKSNPIFGVRSEYGIHFIIIQRSALDETVDSITLNQYYQAYAPSQAEWNKELNGKTYVDYAGFTNDVQLQRANAVKDAIKSYDGTYEYNIYYYLMDATEFGGTYKAEDRFNINGEDDNAKAAKQLLEEIDEYVTRQQEKSEYEQNEGFKLAWKNFIDKFNQQEAERAKSKRVIPYGCAIGFKETGHDALYKIGGPCYYGKKVQ